MRSDSVARLPKKRIEVKTDPFQQLFDPLARVESLGVELVGNHALLGVDHHFSRDEALAVGGQGAFAADELVLVDPLPGAALEVMPHPFAIDQIQCDRPLGREDPLDRLQDGQIILLPVKITEGIAHQRNAVEIIIRETEFTGVAFVEIYIQAVRFGALFRQADQVAGAIDTGHMVEAPPRQFQAMASLAAAEVQDPVIGLEPGRADEQVDLLLRVAVVLHHIPVGLDVDGIEQCAPPFGWQMALQVHQRAERFGGGGVGNRLASQPGLFLDHFKLPACARRLSLCRLFGLGLIPPDCAKESR